MAVPFRSDVYRVLIASPSDLEEERRVATDAINEWNAQHAAAEATVLLPVKWESHAMPETGVRPQGAINRQLVENCDLLIGMFWTKLGTSIGVADSGTVEEIDQFVAAGKPTMLYFSSRPVDPNKIDLKQQRRLRQFKAETYKTAYVGHFASTSELHGTLLRDLINRVREMRSGRRPNRGDKLDQTTRLVDLMMSCRKNKITPAEIHQFRDELLGPRHRPAGQVSDPIKSGEVGPNGCRVSYTRHGDKVEWIPDEENPGEEWPLILRRSDKSINKAAEEFETVIWYDRKLVLQQRLEQGLEKLNPEIEKGMLEAMQAAERKYGKKKIRNYYQDDFGWGMLNGKLSALRWVLGAEWDMLDT
jgi:hypothetical protein